MEEEGVEEQVEEDLWAMAVVRVVEVPLVVMGEVVWSVSEVAMEVVELIALACVWTAACHMACYSTHTCSQAVVERTEE